MLEAGTLEAYVGAYPLAPAFVLTVTREGARLFVQATGQPRFELFAETRDAFFLQEVDAQVTFTRRGRRGHRARAAPERRESARAQEPGSLRLAAGGRAAPAWGAQPSGFRGGLRRSNRRATVVAHIGYMNP